MMRNNSGDQLNQLQNKIKELMENNESQIAQLNQKFDDEKKLMNDDFQKQLAALKEEYE